MPNIQSIFDDQSAKKPVRQPGSKRQRFLAIGIVAVILVLVGGAYLAVQPKKETFLLKSYSAAAVAAKTIRETVQVSGVLDVPRYDRLPSPEKGTVTSIGVKAGEWVKKNQVLMTVGVKDLEADLKNAQNVLQKSQREGDKAELQYEFNLENIDREIKALTRSLTEAQKSYDQTVQLLALKAKSQADINAAQDAVEKARDALDAKVASRDQTVKQYEFTSKNDEIDRDSLRQNVKDLQARIAACVIRAPNEAQVLEVAVQESDNVQQNGVVITLADTRQTIASVEIPETSVNRVSVGMTAEITTGGVTYRAKVESVGVQAQNSSGGYGATVAATLSFVDKPSVTTPGTSVTASLVLGTKDKALTLPRGAFLTTGNGQYVYVLQGSKAVKREVAFGVTESDLVEITSGLSEGDRIITSGYQDFIGFDEITTVPTVPTVPEGIKQ